MDLTRNYKGFSIKFVIPKKIKNYCEQNNIDISEILENDWLWFEVTLFDIISKGKDGSPDKKFGKDFQIIFYELITKYINKQAKGFNVQVDFSNKKVLSEGTMSINSKFVKYKLFKNQA